MRGLDVLSRWASEGIHRYRFSLTSVRSRVRSPGVASKNVLLMVTVSSSKLVIEILPASKGEKIAISIAWVLSSLSKFRRGE